MYAGICIRRECKIFIFSIRNEIYFSDRVIFRNIPHKLFFSDSPFLIYNIFHVCMYVCIVAYTHISQEN